MTKPVRVLHLHAGNLFGGVERIALTLHTERAKAPGLSSRFVACFEGEFSRQLTQLGAPIHLLHATPRISRPWSIWKARKQLRQLLESEAIDLVTSHSAWSTHVLSPAAKELQIPVLLWQHDLWSGTPMVERLARKCPPDAIIANSRFTASTTPKLFPQLTPTVIHAPVSPPVPITPEERESLRLAHGARHSDTVVAHVGRMDPIKGHAALIEAFARIRSDRIHVWFIGGAQTPTEQAYLADLQALARRRKLEQRLQFIGQVPEPSRLLQSADLYCQPNSAPESFGLSLVEAMDAGLPVIATALGGSREIVSAGAGILLEAADPRLIAEALIGLVGDAERRKRLAVGAKARARSLCDPARQLAHFQELVMTTLDQARADRPARKGKARR